MALLSVADRSRVQRALMRHWSVLRVPCAFTKTELAGLIADIDEWIDGRTGVAAPDAVGLNGALKGAYRSKPDDLQKNDLFLAVSAMRRGPDYIKRTFGETE